MSLLRELVKVPVVLDDELLSGALKAMAREAARRGESRGVFESRFRRELQHPLHMAGWSNVQLRDLQRYARSIFHSEVEQTDPQKREEWQSQYREFKQQQVTQQENSCWAVRQNALSEQQTS